MIRTKREKGMTLVDVMISSSLLAVVVMSFTAYFSYLAKFQLKQNQNRVVDEVLLQVFNNVMNPTAWQNTISDPQNTNFACLTSDIDATDCLTLSADSEATAATGHRFFLKDNAAAGGNVIIDPWGQDGGAAGGVQGFNERGERCSTFVQPPGAGNSLCPFFVSLYWMPLCYPGRKCNYPVVKVVATFTYNPGADSSRANAFNPNFHKLVMYRQSLAVQKFDKIYIDDAMANNTNGGNCLAAPTANPRALNSATVIDEGGNVSGVTAATGLFTLKAGTYECEMSSMAKNVNAHQIKLHNNATGAVLLNGTSEMTGQSASGSSYGGQSQSKAYGTFSLSAATQLRVSHYTQSCVGSADHLGKAVNLGNNEIYFQLWCTKME